MGVGVTGESPLAATRQDVELAILEALRGAQQMLPDDVDLMLDRASVHRALAVEEDAAGDSDKARKSMAQAAELADRALALAPDNHRAQLAVEDLRDSVMLR